MNGIPYILLIIISAFTMNLTLQCSLGIQGCATAKKYNSLPTLINLCIILVSIILVWVLFFKVFGSLFASMLIYILLFPVSYMVYEGLDCLIWHCFLKKETKEESFISFPAGNIAVAVFICMNIAVDFIEVMILSLGFSLGIFLVCLIIREIRRRAALEAVPVYLRGKPLVIISMGLLSLIFTFASLFVLRMINVR